MDGRRTPSSILMPPLSYQDVPPPLKPRKVSGTTPQTLRPASVTLSPRKKGLVRSKAATRGIALAGGSAKVESLAERNRETAARIADMKAEVMQLNLLIDEAATKQTQLAPPINDVRLHWESDPTPSLPDVLFLPFEFDGEFEGTFRQSTLRNVTDKLQLQTGAFWSAAHQRSDCAESDCSCSISTQEFPQLTYETSSASTITSSECDCGLDDFDWNHFPSPPTHMSDISSHQRNSSEASEDTLASLSTTQHGIAAVLEAKHLHLSQKSSMALSVVHVASSPNRSPSIPNRIMPTQQSYQRTYDRSENRAGPLLPSIEFDQSAVGVGRAGRTQRTNRAPRPQPKVYPHSANKVPASSAYTTRNLQRAADEGAPSRADRFQPRPIAPIPPRTSSLSHSMQKPMCSQPCHRVAVDSETDGKTNHVRLDSSVYQKRLSQERISEPQDCNTHALSVMRKPWQTHKLQRLPKLRQRLAEKNPRKRSRSRRVRPWTHPLPLTPRWWRLRNSTLTELSVKSTASDGTRNVPSPDTSPAPQLTNRASLGFQFERALMAELENPSFSRKSSVTTLSNRTLHKFRQASRTSLVGFKDVYSPSSSSVTPTWRIERRSRKSSDLSTACSFQRPTTPGGPRVPLEEPRRCVMQSFLERPAGNRRLPSLIELP